VIAGSRATPQQSYILSLIASDDVLRGG